MDIPIPISNFFHGLYIQLKMKLMESNSNIQPKSGTQSNWNISLTWNSSTGSLIGIFNTQRCVEDIGNMNGMCVCSFCIIYMILYSLWITESCDELKSSLSNNKSYKTLCKCNFSDNPLYSFPTRIYK